MEIQALCWAVPRFHRHPVSAASWLKDWTGVNNMAAGWCGRQRNWGTLGSTFKDREDCMFGELRLGLQKNILCGQCHNRSQASQKGLITDLWQHVGFTWWWEPGSVLYQLSPIFSIFVFTYLCFGDIYSTSIESHLSKISWNDSFQERKITVLLWLCYHSDDFF